MLQFSEGYLSPFLGSIFSDWASLHLDHVNILAEGRMGDIHPVYHTSITTLEVIRRFEAYLYQVLDLRPIQLP